MNKKYSEIVNKLLSKCDSNLVGLVCVGSIARGNGDYLSDYDFVLIWEKIENLPWPEGAFRLESNKLGIRNTTLPNLEKRRWSQIERHAYTHAKIEHDKKDILSKLIKEKCVWYPQERLCLFCDLLFRISYVVNHTNDYKHCWNDREELLLSINRNQPLFSTNLVHRYICWLIELALVTDRQFVPPEKVYLSPWVKKLSQRAYEIYKKATKHKEKLENPSTSALERIFNENVKKIIIDFEKETPLPPDISKYRHEIIRHATGG